MVDVGVSRVGKTRHGNVVNGKIKWTPLSTSVFYTRAEARTVELWETQTNVAELMMHLVSSLFV